jgi:MFS family permease
MLKLAPCYGALCLCPYEELTMLKLRQYPALVRFLTGFFLQTAASTIMLPLLTLSMAARGVDALLIGALATVGSLAYMASLPIAPALIARLGERATFRATLVVGGLSTVGLTASDWPALWALLFALAGLAAGLRYTLAESWVPTLVAPALRGRAMALFQTSIGAAFFLGSGALLLAGGGGPWPRALVIVATLLATAVLWPMRAPVAETSAPAVRLGARGLLAQVGPLVLGAALLGGLFESGLTVALPLYGMASGLSPALAAGLVTALGLGSLAQYPFGYLADRLPWARVVLGAAALIVASAPLLPLAERWPALLLLLGVLWGSAGGGLYTLATIRNGELWRGSQLVGASVVTQFAYMVGDAAGPSLGGLALDLAPRLGLPALVSGAGVAILAVMLWSELRAESRGRRPAAAVDAVGSP